MGILQISPVVKLLMPNYI